VIRELFFTGGAAALAHRFEFKFPRFKGPDGELVYEVPRSMVALVATAVRATYHLRYHTNLKSQLYAAIHEWQTGFHRSTEFSANQYLDVYNGHTRTLNHILDRRPGAYHVMMADIYSLARCSSWTHNHDQR
jgi:Domain of unknown function (DUF6532)